MLPRVAALLSPALPPAIRAGAGPDPEPLVDRAKTGLAGTQQYAR